MPPADVFISLICIRIPFRTISSLLRFPRRLARIAARNAQQLRLIPCLGVASSRRWLHAFFVGGRDSRRLRECALFGGILALAKRILGCLWSSFGGSDSVIRRLKMFRCLSGRYIAFRGFDGEFLGVLQFAICLFYNVGTDSRWEFSMESDASKCHLYEDIKCQV